LWKFFRRKLHSDDVLPVGAKRAGNFTAAFRLTYIVERYVIRQITPGLENVLIGHSTWHLYSSMNRIFKYYRLNVHYETTCRTMGFSSYPSSFASILCLTFCHFVASRVRSHLHISQKLSIVTCLLCVFSLHRCIDKEVLPSYVVCLSVRSSDLSQAT